VSDLTRPGALPLRPLTTGELLDGAVVLLRARPIQLLGLGLLLALAEQVVLFPLRSLARQDISLLPGTGRLQEYGVLVVTGFGTEALIIAILGGVAAREGGRALLGRAAPARPNPRPVSLAVVSLVAMLVCAVAAAPFLVVLEPLQTGGFIAAFLLVAILWPIPYGLIGLAAPAVVIEQRGPGSALLRSLRLASRDALRAAWIRVLGYTAWLIVRLGLITATITLVELFGSLPTETADRLVLAGTAVLANALAYPMLGCLDVMLLLEARMRTEGLDIALRRALTRGVATDASLVVNSRSARSERQRAPQSRVQVSG
jgi:hypothetical protein